MRRTLSASRLRPISRGAYLLLLGAITLTVLAGASLARLAALPAPPERLALAPALAGDRRLLLAADDGLVVLERAGAFRLGEDLAARPFSWPTGLTVERVSSVAHDARGITLAVATVRLAAGAPPVSRLLVLAGDQVGVLVPCTSVARCQDSGDLPQAAVRAVPGGFEVLALDREGLWKLALGASLLARLTDAAQPVRWERLPTAPELHLDAVESVLWIGGHPHLQVTERGARWLVDLSGRLRALPTGAWAVWSPSAARARVSDGTRAQFLDEAGVATPVASDAGFVALAARGGALRPIGLGPGHDEPTARETFIDGRRLALKLGRGTLGARTLGIAFTRVASTLAPTDFDAFPVGAGWIALDGTGRQTLRLGADGQRLGQPGAAVRVRQITGLPLAAWLALFGATLALALGAPVVVARARRTVSHLRAKGTPAGGLFVGTLRLGAGRVAAAGNDGRVALAGDAELAAPGGPFRIAPGPVRLDGGAPLLDGEPVYVYARVTEHPDGPFRGARPVLAAPSGAPLFFVGRGGAREFEDALAARLARPVVTYALLHLAAAALLLCAIGLRPFAS